MAFPLILLFGALSFNAYACVLPLFGPPVNMPTDGTMDGRECPTSDEQAARQFCDAFKTLSVSNSAPSDTSADGRTFCAEDTSALAPLLNLRTWSGRHCRFDNDPPPDVLLKTAVLRL